MCCVQFKLASGNTLSLWKSIGLSGFFFYLHVGFSIPGILVFWNPYLWVRIIVSDVPLNQSIPSINLLGGSWIHINESSCNIGPQTEWTRAERFCAGMEALGPSIHELTRQFLAKYGFLVFVLQWLHVARFPMEHVGNDVVVFQCTTDGGYYLQHRCGIEICTGRTGRGDCWKNRFCMVQSETILQARPIANLAKHSDDYRRHITMAYHDYRRHTMILSSMVCWHFLFHW